MSGEPLQPSIHDTIPEIGESVSETLQEVGRGFYREVYGLVRRGDEDRANIYRSLAGLLRAGDDYMSTYPGRDHDPVLGIHIAEQIELGLQEGERDKGITPRMINGHDKI